MRVLFKYVDEHGLDILKSLRLKVTPPNEFKADDEFLSSVPDGQAERLFQHITEHDDDLVRSMFNEYVAEGRFRPDDWPRLQIELNARKKAWRQKAPFEFQKIAVESAKESVRIASDILTVLSLCKTCKEQRMWIRYGKNYEGFVVGFDANHPFLTEGATSAVYSGEKPAVNLVDLITGSREAERAVFESARTKNPDLDSEKEVRFFFRKNTCREENGRYYTYFDPQMIKVVVLGSACNETLSQKIVAAVKNNQRLSHVVLRRIGFDSARKRLVAIPM